MADGIVGGALVGSAVDVLLIFRCCLSGYGTKENPAIADGFDFLMRCVPLISGRRDVAPSWADTCCPKTDMSGNASRRCCFRSAKRLLRR